MPEILTGTVLGLTALLAALATILCAAAALHWGERRSEGLVPLLFYAVAFDAAISGLLSGRNLNLPIDIAFEYAKHPLAEWVTRATSLFVILVVGERIARRFLHFGTRPQTPAPLVFALWLFFFATVISPALFSSHPTALTHDQFYAVLVLYAALLLTGSEADKVLRHARNTILLFLLVSAACIPVRPELVLTDQYAQSVIPGFTTRYAGLANANALGPLSILFMLCLWIRPYSSRWVNGLAWVLGSSALVFSQNKTGWIAFILCAVCVACFSRKPAVPGPDRHASRALPALALLAAGMLVIGGFWVFTMLDAGDTLAGLVDQRTASNLSSLTGRDRIWDISLEEWRDNPVFGYGLGLWDIDYRAHLGMPEAVHAHNQVVHSLSTAGLIGVAGLAIYLAALLWGVVKTARASRGLTPALFTLLCVHSFTEVPFGLGGYGPATLMQMLLLMVIATTFSATVANRAPVARPVRQRFAPSW